jgi:hypothetical protein
VVKKAIMQLGGRAVIFNLTGVAGVRCKVGAGAAAAEITMDALEFNILASGRSPYVEGRTNAILSGDTALAAMALTKTLVLY